MLGFSYLQLPSVQASCVHYTLTSCGSPTSEMVHYLRIMDYFLVTLTA